MKKLGYLMIMLMIGFVVISCNKDDEEANKSKEINPIDTLQPENVPLIHFDADSIPYLRQTEILSAEEQEMIRENIFGRGWKYIYTNKILSDGHISKDYFWEDWCGGRLQAMYFESENRLREFSFGTSDPTCFLRQYVHQVSIDYGTGDVLTSSYSLKFRIIGVEKRNGRWYLYTVQKINQRGWIFNQCVELTDKEMAPYWEYKDVTYYL